MKLVYNLLILGGLAVGSLACGDPYDFRTESLNLAPAGARVKLYHASTDAPGIVVYLNDKVFSGVSTLPAVPAPLPAALTYGGSYPTTDYALVTPGATAVKVTVAATATTPETPGFTGSLTTQDNTYYSVFLLGAAPTYEVLTVQDKLTTTPGATAFLRVANLIPNSPAGGYEVTVNGKTLTTVAAYKGITDFLPIDIVAYGGAAVPITARNGTVTLTTTLSPNVGRYYTLLIRGQVGSTTRPPTIALTTNR
jgi:hypothetical protein